MRALTYLWRFLCLILCLWPLAVRPQPALAVAGPLLAHVADRVDGPALVLRRADGALHHEIPLPDGLAELEAKSVSPNGRWLAYTTGSLTLPPEPPGGERTLHILDVSSGREVRAIPLLPPNFPDNIAVTADLLIDRDPTLDDSRYFSRDEFEEGIYWAFESALSSLAWSPDGETLAFGGAMDGPTADVYVYTPAEDALLRLTDGIEQVQEIRWSPDGRWVWHNSVAYGYCQVCGGGIYAASADGSTVVTLSGDEIPRFLGWLGPTTYLTTDQANGPGDFDLGIVDLTGRRSRQLWPGIHRRFALDLAGERLAVTGALTATGFVFPYHTFVVDLATGERRQYTDSAEARAAGEDASLLDALDQAPNYPCEAMTIIVRPCVERRPTDNAAPDGHAAVQPDGSLSGVDGDPILPPAPELAGGAVYWRPDSAGYFVLKERVLFYRDRQSGAVRRLDEGARSLRWLMAAQVEIGQEEAAPEEVAQEEITSPASPPDFGPPVTGDPGTRAYQLRLQQAEDLAALALAPEPTPNQTGPGLPLLLAREAALTTLRLDFLDPNGFLPRASGLALQTVVENAAPWVATFPAGGPLPSPYSMALSPDGVWVATGHSDGSVRLWNVESGRLVRTFAGSSAPVNLVAFSPDSRQVAAAAHGGIVNVWNLLDGSLDLSFDGRYSYTYALVWEPGSHVLLIANGQEPVQRVDLSPHQLTTIEPLAGVKEPATALAYSPDGSRLAVVRQRSYSPAAGPRTTSVASGPLPMLLIDTATGEQIALPPHEGVPILFGFSPDSRYLASGDSRRLRIWDARDGALLHDIEQPEPPDAFTFTPGGEQLVVLARRAGLIFWDLASGTEARRLPVETGVLSWLAFHPTEDRLVSTEVGGRPVLIDAATGAPDYRFDNPDAAHVATHPTRPLAATAGRRAVDLRDLETHQTIRRLTGFSANVTAIAFDPAGDELLAGDALGMVTVWAVDRDRLLRSFQAHNQAITHLAVTGDGLVVTLADDRSVAVHNGDSGEELHRLTFDTLPHALDASAGGQIAVAVEERLLLVNATSGEQRGELAGHTGRLVELRFSPDGRTLAAQTDRGAVVLWDVASGELRHTLTPASAFFAAGLAFSPDGSLLAAGAGSGQNGPPIQLWDVTSGELVRALPPILSAGYGPTSDELAFSADGRLLLSADLDRRTRVYSLQPTRSLRPLIGHHGPVWDADLGPAGRSLATVGEDGTLRLWNLETGALWFLYEQQPDRLFAVDYSQEAAAVAIGGADGEVRVYTVSNVPTKTVLRGHTSWVDEVVFSPDGASLASAGADNTVRVWDLATGRERWQIADLPLPAGALAYSPDGALLAGAAGPGDLATIYLWDAATGEEVATLRGHTSYVAGLAFSPDGATLASASWDYTAKLWDVATGETLQTFQGHSDILTGIAFHPWDDLIATVAEDYTLRLWDPDTGDEVDRIDLPRSLPWSVTFNGDGHALITTHQDGIVRTWLTSADDASSEALLLRASALTPRATAEFTFGERRAYGIDTYIGSFALSASANVNIRPWPSVKSMAVWPGEPETLMVLTDEQFLLRSQDRGTTWEITDRLPLTLTVNGLGLPARPGDPLLLATEQGLYRYHFQGIEPATQGNRSAARSGWVEQIHPRPLKAVSFSHTNPDELWAIGAGENGAQVVLKSEDGGATWGEAGLDRNANLLYGPLLMAPPNNNPQFVIGAGLDLPALTVWRGTGNGFWKRLPGLPQLPLGLAHPPSLAWDSDNAILYLGGLHGELYASANAAATDEQAPAAEIVHDFGPYVHPLLLAVGAGPTIYINHFQIFGPTFRRGVWDGERWRWEEIYLPIVAAG